MFRNWYSGIYTVLLSTTKVLTAKHVPATEDAYQIVTPECTNRQSTVFPRGKTVAVFSPDGQTFVTGRYDKNSMGVGAEFMTIWRPEP
ncbi:hypothetical protein J0895_23590 [Phormidium pseudopriestleyi FRX01]|uniref:Serine protease n=1 Tax=Phormidium pseudopriestleyi FRX01 TaxID=1759528 RepID=A0ABS3FXZ3_9CYAN|nr:hypothetical protein [Phormidium pseudopriestleyi]MBO0352009.1 hypothetical protein [Phormidium pseudopriestleyi FRX01]